MITLKFVLRTSEAVLQMLGPIYRFGNYQLNRSRTFFIVPNFAELWSRCDEIWVRISNLDFFCQKTSKINFRGKKIWAIKSWSESFGFFCHWWSVTRSISVTESISVNAGHTIFSYNNSLGWQRAGRAYASRTITQAVVGSVPGSYYLFSLSIT